VSGSVPATRSARAGTTIVLISFAIPAHNEHRLLPTTIGAIRDAAGRLSLRYEVIVADDGSTDATADIARAHGAVVVSIRARQIAATRNAAARASSGDVLIFVDADTRVSTDAVGAALDAIRAGAIGGGAMVRFDGRVPTWAGLMLGLISAAFRVLRLCGGCFLFCTRRAYDAAGGWNESVYAGEEIDMARALKRHGRFVIIRPRVVTSGRKLRAYSAGEIFGTMARVALSPRSAVRDRRRLGLWYEPRRADPIDVGDRNGSPASPI
jgi:glycosyltransferase involved in cell wall biosynthesis